MMESVEQFTSRLMQQCHDMITSELAKYFSSLIITGYMRQSPKKKPPREGTNVKKLLDLLDEGPQFADDLKLVFATTDNNFYNLISRAKEHLRGTFKCLVREGNVYAIRDEEMSD